jgi:hypothetical protein
MGCVWITGMVLLGQLAANEKGRALLASPLNLYPLVVIVMCYSSTPFFPKVLVCIKSQTFKSDQICNNKYGYL